LNAIQKVQQKFAMKKKWVRTATAMHEGSSEGIGSLSEAIKAEKPTMMHIQR
jgi:hypothetical protein